MKAIPLYHAGESWTDKELEQSFRTNTPVPKAQLMGLLAKRSPSNPLFLELLEREAIDPDNRGAKFFGFIRYAWLPVLALLEHGNAEGKGRLKGWLAHWSADERSLLMDYLAREPELLAWLRVP